MFVDNKFDLVKDDKEMAYCRLLLEVGQDRIEFVHQAKYELEHMMLVL
jgi:hypothetical protein